MSKSAIWLRVSMLVVAFIAVLFGMHFAQLGYLARPLQYIGIGPLPVAPNPTHITVNFCPTRVAAIEIRGGLRIFQEGKGWVKKTDKVVKLDTVGVEKWLAQHCRTSAEILENVSATPNEWRKALVFYYIDGTSRILEQRASVFRAGGEYFSAPDFEKALEELRSLADFNSQP